MPVYTRLQITSSLCAAVAALLLSLGAVACGPNDCDQVTIDINNRTMRCGGAPWPEGEPCDRDEGCYVCTEDRAKLARCHSECVKAADCGAFLGSHDDALALGNCMADCYDLIDN